MKIKADVCIIGTGFCGYAAYRNLSGLGLKIVVIEGGDIPNPENAIDQKSYNVKQNKSINKKFNLLNKLDLSFRDRRYTLGGSSEAWSGYIVPLGSQVYNQKFDDWPLEWGSLNLSKYDERSLELLNSPIKHFGEDNIPGDIKEALPKLPSEFKYSFWAFAPKALRLKNFWMPLVASLPQNIDSDRPLICNYQLKDFRVDKSSEIIKEFVFESPGNQTLFVEADYFIVACGGLENSYLAAKIDKTIKMSFPQKIKKKAVVPDPIFVEHPHLYQYAYIKLASGVSLPKALTSRVDLSEAKVSGAGKGSFKLCIVAGGEGGVPGMSFEFHSNAMTIRQKIVKIAKSLIFWEDTFDQANYDYSMHVRTEQSPSKSSVITFSKDKIDTVSWNVNTKDFEHYSGYLKKLLGWLKASSIVEDIYIPGGTLDNTAVPRTNVEGGAHHMTTYPYDRNNQLVDNSFRLLSSKNVYVVGSSLFPVTGWENPTVGAVSTTLHATDHIKEQIFKGQLS